MNERTINYHCVESGSDKVYRLSLTPDGDGYRVRTQYGPRGGRQTQGEKTASSVPYDHALRIFEKEHKARLAKQYHVVGAEGAGGTLVGRSDKTDSGFRPQLLNAIERGDAERYLVDDAYLLQIKLDGERVMIQATHSEVVGINRKGEVRPLPIEVVSVIRGLPLTDARTVLDGELLGATYAPFDLLILDGNDLRGETTHTRISALLALIGDAPSPLVKPVTSYSSADKRAMLAQAEASNEEGVVFKKKNAPYTEGRPNSGGDQFKLKFVETATVRTAGVTPGKRSVAVEVHDGTGRWIGVGNCTIPANFAVPPVGSLVEIQYLYFFPGGAVFQPVYRGLRTDVGVEACTLQQLKLKSQGRTAT